MEHDDYMPHATLATRVFAPLFIGAKYRILIEPSYGSASVILKRRVRLWFRDG